MDEDVIPQMLDKAARSRLRTLSKLNSDWVAVHLVMAGRTLDVDPELAYEHASAAVRRAGRVDVVREALAITAYATGRYAEALREVRTVRRLSGLDAHPAIEADCERGLGRPERALAVIAEAKGRELSIEEAVELTLVESGARADLGEHEAALLVIDKLLPRVREPEYRRRLMLVRADRLETLGRADDAAEARAAAEAIAPQEEDEVVVLDLGEDDEEQAAPAPAPVAATDDADEVESDEDDEFGTDEVEDDTEDDAAQVGESDAEDETEAVEAGAETEAVEVETDAAEDETQAAEAEAEDDAAEDETEAVETEAVETQADEAEDASAELGESDAAAEVEVAVVEGSASEAEAVVDEVLVVEESAPEAVEAEEAEQSAPDAAPDAEPETAEESDEDTDNDSEQLDLFADTDLEDRR